MALSTSGKTAPLFPPLYFLSGVRFPGLASSVIFTSKGPTAGLVNVDDVPEESPAATGGEPGQNVNNEVMFESIAAGFGLLDMRTKPQVLIY